MAGGGKKSRNDHNESSVLSHNVAWVFEIYDVLMVYCYIYMIDTSAILEGLLPAKLSKNCLHGVIFTCHELTILYSI